MGIDSKKEPDGEYDGEDDGKNVHEDVRAGEGEGEDDGDGRARASTCVWARAMVRMRE